MTTPVTRSASRAREILKENGIPYGDDIPLTASSKQFAAGGHYGVEIPAINSFNQLEATVRLLKSEGVYCTRFDETHGSFLLSDSEIKEMLAICREHRYGFLFGLGPRPEYDVKASFYRTPFGLEMGRQLNNHDAFAQAVDEALRLCELGCRGLTIYDIGLLKVLSELREKKYLPSDVIFKTSSHCMPTNAPMAKLFAECGANSITTAHDLGLPVLHAMRAFVPDVILDIPTDVYKSKGGYIRWFELSEMVQVGAPMFLKMGASVQEHPYDSIKPEAALDRVKRVGVGLQYLEGALPSQYKRIDIKDPFFCLPAGPVRARLEAAS
jgi:hypothetical protein